MPPITYSIHSAIFAQFPTFRRGIVLAWNLTNGPSSDTLLALLRKEEETLRGRLPAAEANENPRIKAWREAFRSVGIKPADFRPSIDAMARRVLRGESLPSINALVDIGNLISLRHLVPTGSHAVDHLTKDIALRPASGSENFIPFGSETLEHPEPGEWIFVEDQTVLTRRWAWRQSIHTLTLPETTAVEFNIDALPVIPDDEVQLICSEVAGLVQRFCGGATRVDLISAAHPQITFDV